MPDVARSGPLSVLDMELTKEIVSQPVAGFFFMNLEERCSGQY